MNKRLLLLSLPIFLSISILFLTTSSTFADNDPIDPVFNTETGTYYKFVQDVGISWNDAELIAGKLSHDGFIGQLAVITTQDENDFITDLLPDESSAWIGLSEHNGEYEWINEEIFDYSNWSNFQPTNNDYENYVELFEYNGKWNDTVNGNHDIIGYVVEYINPGINYAPDIYNPDNGHYYYYVNNNVDGLQNQTPITWEHANYYAESFWRGDVKGHLVTITDEDERDFVAGILPFRAGFTMIGLSDKEIGEGEFTWVTGEPFDYPTLDYFNNSNTPTADVVYIDQDGYFYMFDDHDLEDNWTVGYVIEFSP